MATVGTNAYGGGGSIVLRGNQLVWVPSSSGEPCDVGVASGMGPGQATTPQPQQPSGGVVGSPIKIQVINAVPVSNVSAAVGMVPNANVKSRPAVTGPVTIFKVNPSRFQPIATITSPSLSSGNDDAQQQPRSAATTVATFAVRRQPSPTSCQGPSTILLKGNSLQEHFGTHALNSNADQSFPLSRTPVRRTYPFSVHGSDMTVKNTRQQQRQNQPRFKIIIPASSGFVRSTRTDVAPSIRTLQPIQTAANYSMKPVSSPAGQFLIKPKEEPNVLYVTGPGDFYSEDDVQGLTVGANSLQSVNLTEVSSINAKKNVYLKSLKKPCNCTKSMCLKLYCECFANGEFCKNCNCTNCKNMMTSENDRSRAIKSCLEKNPTAFQPKIGKGRADTDRLHNKGCNCKKSSCLKNYCECYEAKVACTSKCKCVACRNTEVDRNHKIRSSAGLSSGSMSGSFLSSTQQPIVGTLLGRSFDDPSRNRSAPEEYDENQDSKKMPWYYLNDDVVQATALCLVAQAEQLESAGVLSEAELQSAVLQEFGACLQQIIQSAGGNSVDEK